MGSGATMADKSGLGFIGLMLGTATLLVMVIGAVVVTDYASGARHFDDGIASANITYAAR
jgi:hypothetical protein